jgi:predicted permease
MQYRGRRWNNILMLGVIVFMAVLYLPTLIKAYLVEESEVTYPSLFDSSHQVVALYSSDWSLIYHDGEWQSTPQLDIDALELKQRWNNLLGTYVPDDTFKSLKGTLPSANTVEVWYDGIEEPQRITYYRTPNFWLFKNWQQQWIAVSVDAIYLFPALAP